MVVCVWLGAFSAFGGVSFFCDFCVFGVLFVLYCTFFRIFAIVLNLKERVYMCGFLMVEMEKEDWKIRIMNIE